MRYCVEIIEKVPCSPGIGPQYSWQACNRVSVLAQIPPKNRNILSRPTIMVITDGPYSKRAPAKPPKLLRDPQEAARILMRSQGKAIADDPNADFWQGRQSCLIKGVGRCHPHLRFH